MTLKNHADDIEPTVWFEFVGEGMTDEEWLEHGPFPFGRFPELDTPPTSVWVMLGTIHYRDIAGVDHDLDVTIDLDDESGLPVVTSVNVLRRPGPRARAIGSRSVAELGVGQFVEHAFKSLIVETDGPGLPVDRREASDKIRARLVERTPRDGSGFEPYTDAELRFAATHYVGSSYRRRYPDVWDAYRKSKRFEMPTSDSALRRRISEARKRIDPTTGMPFLDGDDKNPFIPGVDD